MDVTKWAKLQESLLKSQLKIIRQFLREGDQPKRKTGKKGMSQMDITYDILAVAQKPLHITEIIAQANQNYNVTLNRDSVVSALTKKVKDRHTFKRVAPNTFALLDSTIENSD
jgi:predicted transcriptional regulator